MTRNLREHPRELDFLAEATSAHLGIPKAFVEKDFWVTEVLRAATAACSVRMNDGFDSPVSFVFKGGTSLSRVFGLINRFSEDVDLLAVFPPMASISARHTVLKQVDRHVQEHLGLSQEEVSTSSSTNGVKRFTRYPYRATSSSSEIREGVLLELGTRGSRSPFIEHEYRSLISDFAIRQLGEADTAWEEFGAFRVLVLAPERTLLEKLSAVHDAAVRRDSRDLVRFGRHFHDIHFLLKSDAVLQSLTDLGAAGIQEIFHEIYVESLESGLNASPRPEGGYANSPAFDPDYVLSNEIARGVDLAKGLLYVEGPSIHEIRMTVRQFSALL